MPTNSFWSHLLKEVKANKVLVSITAAFIILSFSIYLFLDDELICRLGRENSLFESLTPVFFLAASVILLRIFLRKKNAFYLLLSVFFFVGMGEEISWGQKLWHFSTPAAISKANVQREFNIHNLGIFDSRAFNGTHRTGWKRIPTINFLYKLFWFAYCILLPIGFYWIRPVQRISRRIRLPVPPLALGMLFVPNYLIMKALGALLPYRGSYQYFDTAGEIYECGTALIFLAISLYFLKTTKGPVPDSRE